MDLTWPHILHILQTMAVWALGLLFPVALAVYAWVRRDMLNWVHVAFYFVAIEANGKKSIMIRTVDLLSVRQLMMNNIFATYLIYRAATKSTREQPVLTFSNETAWRVKNLCRGHLSSLFPEGVLAKAMQLPVHADWFVVTLIRDETQRGDSRVGLAILRRNDIQDQSFLVGDPEVWRMEAEHHDRKLALLRHLQKTYLNEQANPSGAFQFLDVELYRPK